MTEPTPRIKSIITRFLSREATDAEIAELDAWLHDSKSNLRYFDEMNQLFQEQKVAETLNEHRLQQAWSTIQSKVDDRSAKPLRRRVFTPALGIAASITIACLSIFYFVRKEDPSRGTHAPTIVENRATTTKRIILPDGTVVWLNVNSSIAYGSDFADHRDVMLTGEAFFDVTHRKNKFFKVHTPAFTIEVKGTRFNVQAYDTLTKEATLEEGSIELTVSGSAEKYTMIPGDQILINNDEKTVIRKKVRPQSFTSWKEAILDFDNTPLSEIVIQLENRFNVNITVSQEIADRERFTMQLHDESLEEVLEMIHLSSNLHYKIENKNVEIYE